MKDKKEKDYKTAKKYISNVIVDHNIKYLPLTGAICSMPSSKEQTFKTERIILWFLNKRNLPVLRNERELFREKLTPKINHSYNDKYENQLLRIFDFTAWIESKIFKKSLTETLQQHINAQRL